MSITTMRDSAILKNYDSGGLSPIVFDIYVSGLYYSFFNSHSNELSTITIMKHLEKTLSLNIDDVIKNKNLKEVHLHDIIKAAT
ncbi:MAG: hypothetical protein GY941_26870, partial [Planctomycetes bacterium]|nr:hypothetical protein [Planctomycetota bacterium]